MSQMTWLHLYSDIMPFKAGVASGEGVVDEMGDKGDFDKVVLYKAVGKYAGQPIMVDLNSLAQLYAFVGAAAKDLYRRGVMR